MTLLIDTDELYHGSRIAGLSDQAKLHWPWLFLASNSYGRIELNHRRLLGTVYTYFAAPPDEATVLAMADEYQRQRLLFIYGQNSQLWGQWEVPAQSLPKYKLKRDDLSPAPPPDLLTEWRKT